MSDNEERNFFYFLALIAVMGMTHCLFFQIRPFGYMSVIPLFRDFQFSPITISLIDPAPKFLNLIPAWVPRWLELIGMILLLRPLTRRTGAAFMVFSILYIAIFQYPAIGVGDPILFLVAGALLFFPGFDPDGRLRARSLIIGLIGGVYFCSAIVKINSDFLTGLTLKYEVARILKPYARETIQQYDLGAIASLSGMLLEMSAAAIVFPAISGLGFVAAVLFHCANAAQINWTLSLLALPGSLPFLLNWKKSTTGFYFSVVASIVMGVHAFALWAGYDIGPVRFSPATFSKILVAVPLVFGAFVLWYQRSELGFCSQSLRAAVSIQHLRLRAAGFFSCLLLTGLCRYFEAPTPFGFTQFSGATSGTSTQFVLAAKGISENSLNPVIGSFTPRWDIRTLFLQDRVVAYSFPSAMQRDHFITSMCERAQDLRFGVYEVRGLGLPSQNDNLEQNAAARVALSELFIFDHFNRTCLH